MNKNKLIKDLNDIVIIIGFNSDMFKEHYNKDITSMIKEIINRINNGKYEK